LTRYRIHVFDWLMANNTDATPDKAVKQNPSARKKPRSKKKRKPLSQWNVVLLDDNDHSYEYVVDMLQSVFAHSPEAGYQLAKIVDTDGRAIVFTSHREHAELKREQIIAFGADPRLQKSRGSMSAVIEPAEVVD